MAQCNKSRELLKVVEAIVDIGLFYNIYVSHKELFKLKQPRKQMVFIGVDKKFTSSNTYIKNGQHQEIISKGG